MHLSTHQRITRAFVAGVIMASIVSVVAAPASAAPPISVDFTVSEGLPPGTPGDLISSDVPNCPAVVGSVATPTATRTDTGPLVHFRGTKVVDCGEGNTFTLTFRATASGCSTTDSGTWKLVDGTGVFAGAKGHGALVGTYTLGVGPGTFCENDGIDDHYTGKMKLAS